MAPSTSLDPQARKHIQNQPLDLNAEQTKAALNPKVRKWLWLVRNVRLRCFIVLGSPLTDAACPKGLAVADVATVHNNVKAILRGGGTMPAGCKADLRDAGASRDNIFVEKVHLAWDTIHVVDTEFAGGLQSLLERYTGGSVEGAGGDATEEEEPEPAPAQERARGAPAPGRAKRPPSGRPAKGRPLKKRKEAEPVVPVQPPVRSLVHRRSEERVQRALAEAVAAMQEEEAGATVVHPPFVVGQVKPFPVWPHGGVAIHVQFPFLLDQSWRDLGKWTVRCRKVVVQAVGGRYKMVFSPKVPSPAGTVGVGGPNGIEPLLPAAAATDGPPTAPPIPVEGDRAADARGSSAAVSDNGAAAAPADAAAGTAAAASGRGAAAVAAGSGPAVAAARGSVPATTAAGGAVPAAARGVAAAAAVGGGGAPAATTGGGAMAAAAAVGAVAAAASRGAAPAANTDAVPVAAAGGGAAPSSASGAEPIAAAGGGAAGGAAVGDAAAAAGGGAAALPAAAADGVADASPGAGMSAAMAGRPTPPSGRNSGRSTTAADDAETGGAAAAVTGERVPPGVLAVPQEPTDYVPMSEAMQSRLERAVRWGKEAYVEPFEEQLEWSILASSPATNFCFSCTFTTNLELEGSAVNLPSGSHRSSNWLVAGYAARNPLDGLAQDLD